MRTTGRLARHVTAAALLAASPMILAQQKPDASELDQRLRILERKLEIQAEEAQAKAKDATSASAGEKGFSLKSANGEYELKIRALAQIDGRFFLQDVPARRFNDSFLVRRLRPTFEGSLGKLVGFRLTPEFAGDGSGLAASIVDAYADLKFHPAASLRIGKQKGPVGIERLQSGGAISFIERGYPTELAPNRDIGAAVFGELAAGAVNYTLGIFNGTADGRDVAGTDADNRHELEGRVFLEPFRNSPGLFQNFGFGIGGTSGAKLSTVSTTVATNTASANAVLPRYRTPGQNQFFNYSVDTTAPVVANTVIANGGHTRLAPQLYWYYNRVGLLGEYAASEQTVSLAGTDREFEHKAYEVTATLVLTGEDASYRGVTKPRAAYTVNGEGWGALELALRYGELDVDDRVFTEVIPGATTPGGTFARANASATSAASASKATSYGVGFNWYLTPNAKLVLDYDTTQFEGGAAAGSAAGADREDERALFTRIQLTY